MVVFNLPLSFFPFFCFYLFVLFSFCLDYIQIKKPPIISFPVKLLFTCIRLEKSKIVLERAKDKLLAVVTKYFWERKRWKDT